MEEKFEKRIRTRQEPRNYHMTVNGKGYFGQFRDDENEEEQDDSKDLNSR